MMRRWTVIALLALAQSAEALFPLQHSTTVDVHEAVTVLLQMAQRRQYVLNVETAIPPPLVQYRVRGRGDAYTTSVSTVVYYTIDQWLGATNRSLPLATDNSNRFHWLSGTNISIAPAQNVLWASLRTIDAVIASNLLWHPYADFPDYRHWTAPRMTNIAEAESHFATDYGPSWEWQSTQWMAGALQYHDQLPRLLLNAKHWTPSNAILSGGDIAFARRFSEDTLADYSAYWTTVSWTSRVVTYTNVPGWFAGILSTQFVAQGFTNYMEERKSHPLLWSKDRYSTSGITLGYFRADLFPHTNTATAQYPLSAVVSFEGDTNTYVYDFAGYHRVEEDWQVFWPGLWFFTSQPKYVSAGSGYELRISKGPPWQGYLSWTSSPSFTSTITIAVSPEDTNWLSEVTWRYHPGSALTHQLSVPHSSSITAEVPYVFVHPSAVSNVTLRATTGSTNWPSVAPLSFFVGTGEVLTGWTLQEIGQASNTPVLVAEIKDRVAGESVCSNRLAGLVFNDQRVRMASSPWPFYPTGGWEGENRFFQGICISNTLVPDHIGDEIALVHPPAHFWANIDTISHSVLREHVTPESLNARFDALRAMHVFSFAPNDVQWWLSTSAVNDVTCLSPITNSYSAASLWVDIPSAEFILQSNYYGFGASWGHYHRVTWLAHGPDDAPSEDPVEIEASVSSSFIDGRAFFHGSRLRPRFAFSHPYPVVDGVAGDFFVLYGAGSIDQTNCSLQYPWPTNEYYMAADLGVEVCTNGLFCASVAETAFETMPAFGWSQVSCMAGKTNVYMGSWDVHGSGVVTGNCGTYSIPSNRIAVTSGDSWGIHLQRDAPSWVGLLIFDYVEED
jgi:hypothetical protein